MKTEKTTDENTYLVKLDEIKKRDRTLEKFAIDDYEAWIVFTKKLRQNVSQLYSEVPDDDPAKKVVFDHIKNLIDSCDKRGQKVWCDSDYSAREVSAYAEKVLEPSDKEVD